MSCRTVVVCDSFVYISRQTRVSFESTSEKIDPTFPYLNTEIRSSLFSELSRLRFEAFGGSGLASVKMTGFPEFLYSASHLIVDLRREEGVKWFRGSGGRGEIVGLFFRTVPG